MGANQGARRRGTTALESHGREPSQDGPETRAGGSFEVAELAE